jgi:hypothetical protein
LAHAASVAAIAISIARLAAAGWIFASARTPNLLTASPFFRLHPLIQATLGLVQTLHSFLELTLHLLDMPAHLFHVAPSTVQVTSPAAATTPSKATGVVTVSSSIPIVAPLLTRLAAWIGWPLRPAGQQRQQQGCQAEHGQEAGA